MSLTLYNIHLHVYYDERICESADFSQRVRTLNKTPAFQRWIIWSPLIGYCILKLDRIVTVYIVKYCKIVQKEIWQNMSSSKSNPATSAAKWLITTNRIQKKRFSLHNIRCVFWSTAAEAYSLDTVYGEVWNTLTLQLCPFCILKALVSMGTNCM